jgi:hypothetical protein
VEHGGPTTEDPQPPKSRGTRRRVLGRLFGRP